MAKRQAAEGGDGGGETAAQTPARKEMIKLVKMPEDNTKLAPQAKGICAALKAMGAGPAKTAKPVAHADLMTRLPEFIETRQPASRVYGFYRNALVQGGFITSEKVAAA